MVTDLSKLSQNRFSALSVSVRMTVIEEKEEIIIPVVFDYIARNMHVQKHDVLGLIRSF